MMQQSNQTLTPPPQSREAADMATLDAGRPLRRIHIGTLAQLAQGAPWRMGLMHALPHHLFLWVTRGQGRGVIMGKRTGIGTHNALLIPAHTLFSLDLGKQGFGLAVQIPTEANVTFPDTDQHLRLRDVLVQGELTSILDTMQREQTSARPYGEEAAVAHAQLLSVWLRRTLINTPPESARPLAAERLVRSYCTLLERDYRSGRPMADYAEALNVTPTHLTRSCRQCAGLTAADILTQRSLHAARDLLETSDVPINRISQWLGFGSAAYFTRFIQHHTTKTPSDLRKLAKSRPSSVS
jgi:AraC family transcriptional activator of pobA